MPDTVLLIDKDQGHTNALTLYLERQQFEVTSSTNFEELLVFIENLTPEFIIADPDLPHQDTIHLLEQIKKTTPRTQIIITTPKKDLDKAIELLGSNSHHYLEKPVKGNLLDLALKEAREKLGLLRKLDHNERRLSSLTTAENLYRQLFDEVPCYISVQDDQFRITAANTLFKKNFGSQIGTYCYEIYKQRSTPCEKCPVAATFKDGLSHQTEEIVTSKDGTQYNVLTFTAPIRNGAGRITQVMEMSTNITQIRQLQDHLTSLGLMLGSMSHGVKGMLTAMDGGIYQLETGITKKDEKRTEKALVQVKQMAGRIRKMVLEILYYAKSRALRYQTLQIEELANTVVNTARPMAEKNGIRLKSDIPSDLGGMEVDPNWVQSALVNLLENAVDACTHDRSKADHYIKFNVLETEKNNICLIIEDNGMGMDTETRNKMFTLFFTSKGSQGTGLGLFITNRVITQHGGHIHVDSTPQEGSRFQICLPRYRPETTRVVDFPNNNNSHS